MIRSYSIQMISEGFEEFVAVVEEGSISSASKRLALPRPTVSKRLARLEERLGVRLLHRSTRRLTLTPSGTLLFPKAKRVIESAKEAEEAVKRLDDTPRGLLRVTVPSSVPIPVFTSWITEFLELYPEISFDLLATDDHLDLIGEGIDLALRSGPIEDLSLVARTIVHNRGIAIASPKYLATHGWPQQPQDLAKHHCIVGYDHLNQAIRQWPLLSGGTINVNGRLSTNKMDIRLEAAIRHQGIAFVIDRIAEDALARGDVVQVLADSVGEAIRVRLVYPERAYTEAKVSAFIEFLCSRLKHKPGIRPK